MLQGLDSSMSNLTSGISNEASISSSNNMNNELIGTSTNKHDTNQPPTKKRRNLPGNPDPDAEVMALSPGSLMATNRFVCEICNKGFQRDQNLQLHRRGHNLPWKLKQRSKTEVVKKKVYVCPEPSCVHHHPSRALGDLTGIKKHFSRKHGDKKWKCQKCSKRYAVQSDWKAHSKICGTREYRCDCGTLFSRRDSFITHRAFCDALAEESSRSITTQNNHNINLLSSQTAPNHQFTFQHQMNIPLKQENQTTFNLPPWLLSPDQLMFSSSSSSPRIQQSIQENPNNPNNNNNNNNNNNHIPSSFMSATALLQKASQMGVTTSSNTRSMPNNTTQFSVPRQQHHHNHVGAPGLCATTSSPTSTAGMPSREHLGTGFLHGALASSFGDKLIANVTPSCMEQQQQQQQQLMQDHHHHMMNMVGSSSSSLPSTSGAFDGSSLANFEDSFDGMLMKSNINHFQENNALFMSGRREGINGGGGGGGDGMTRDFLGLRAFPDRDFLNMAAFDQMGSSSYDHQTQNQEPWQS